MSENDTCSSDTDRTIVKRVDCPNCNGFGEVGLSSPFWDDPRRCSKCDGTGRITKEVPADGE